MKTWQFYWRLVRYVPWAYAINLAAIVVVFLFEMAPGLIAREFFNRLSGRGEYRAGAMGAGGAAGGLCGGADRVPAAAAGHQ